MATSLHLCYHFSNPIALPRQVFSRLLQLHILMNIFRKPEPGYLL